MSSVETVARRVREEREKAGWSLAQLAEASGVTKTYLVRLETHGGNPSIAVVAQIAEALGLTAADLLGGPVIRYVGDESDVTPSLRRFAEDEGLSSDEIKTLASIHWRQGDVPHTNERWRYVHQSLTMSSSLETSAGGNEEGTDVPEA